MGALRKTAGPFCIQMPLTLTKSFLAGISASRFMVAPGPASGLQAVACAQVSMTRVPCDAYVVPHFLDGRSRIGVSHMVEQTGAAAGFAAYDAFLKGSVVGPATGECYITESGGGLSKYLAHVPCMGDSSEEKDAETVQYATFSSLIMTGGREMDFIVFPPLGVSPYGRLTNERAASMMLKSIFDYLAGSRKEKPNQVLIALNGSEVAYNVFAAELEALSLPGLSAKYSQAPEPAAPQVPPHIDRARAKLIVNSLSDLQLATLYLALGRKNGSMRERCAELPWFGRLEELFTEERGKTMHPFVVEEIRKVADARRGRS